MTTTQPATTPTSMADLGPIFRQARNDRSWSLEDAAFHIRTSFPESGITISRLQRIEKGTSAPIDAVEAVILGETYDLAETVHDLIADQLRPLRDLLVRRISWFDQVAA